MKVSEARQGRIFVIRLEDGEILHEAVERLAAEKSIRAAWVLAVGGADVGSRLIVGPEDGRASPIVSMEHVLTNVHEIAGVGTIFPDEQGAPILHLHLAAGRGAAGCAGCARQGVKIWHVAEVIVQEITGTQATRRLDPGTGFKLLSP